MTANPILQTDFEPVSVFQSDLPIAEKLDRARMELLDLSARNRLLNMPRSSKGVRSIEIVDEKSAEIFRLLVQDGRVFTFVAGKAARNGDEAEVNAVEGDEIADLAQPEDDVADGRGVFSRHSDTRLQTRLTPKGLQKRLLELYFDARTLEEEQGVNILYLAMGTLRWVDPSNTSNIRHAPLLLTPVSLERGNAGEKFKLRARAEEFASNLSLEAYLDRAHGIRLPEFEVSDGFDPIAYMDQVGEAVSAKQDWSIQHDDMALGFFSFAKFLMYRDLDPETWPEHARINERPLIQGLLSNGFDNAGGMIPEEANIDAFISPADMLHIVDCDSSQALVVHEVRRGRDLVIQGPPGTGKSQTIANIVASAVADGKTVLFVAEKMAALEVVKRRLDATGVGDACLELHSNKANKRALLDELRRTWELGAPKGGDPGTLYTRLVQARDNLNGHASRMHRVHAVSALTPYQVTGQLVRLRNDGERPNDLVLEAPASWSADAFSERHRVLSELAERVEAIGRPADHVWRGVGLSSVTPMDVERFIARFAALAERLQTIEVGHGRLASILEQPAPGAPTDVAPLVQMARRLAGAPGLTSDALASDRWHVNRDEIITLLENGARLSALREALHLHFAKAAWLADATSARAQLGVLPGAFSRQSFAALQVLAELLPRLKMEGEALASVMGRDAPTCLADVRRLARVGERVVAAPDAGPDAFAADLWDTGAERAADLAEAVTRLQQARDMIGEGLNEAAWSMDLTGSRTVLASHGTGLFKIVSGEWRQANRLVRTVISRPGQPLDDTLAQLDALARGQKALKAINDDDAFARSVFGGDWRGERSNAARLNGLVEWMRSLQGLGAEPRIVAANLPDRAEIGLRVKRCEVLVSEIQPLLEEIWSALPTTALVFGEALMAERAGLDFLIGTVGTFHNADRAMADLSVSVPAYLPERLALLDDLIEGQRCAATVGALGDLGQSVFAPLWSGDASDWPTLRQVYDWVSLNEDIRLLAVRNEDRSGLPGLAADIGTGLAGFVGDLGGLLADLRCNIPQTIGVEALSALDFATMRKCLAAWTSGAEQLSKWVAYRERADRGYALGCGDVVARLEDGRLAPDRVIPAFEMAYYEALYADQIAHEPELGRFDGIVHGRLASV